MNQQETETTRYTIDAPLEEWINGEGKWAEMKQNPNTEIDEMKFLSTYTGDEKTNTGNFGELLVKQILEDIGIQVEHQARVGNFKVDLLSDEAIYEVKTRTYSTSGTAGEKTTHVPFKYEEIATKLRPLKVILVGYQEFEAVYKFRLFNLEKAHWLTFYESVNCHYIRLSSLLAKLNDLNNKKD